MNDPFFAILTSEPGGTSVYLNRDRIAAYSTGEEGTTIMADRASFAKFDALEFLTRLIVPASLSPIQGFLVETEVYGRVWHINPENILRVDVANGNSKLTSVGGSRLTIQGDVSQSLNTGYL